MRQIIVIAHNLRSTHNVGSLLRTTEGLGLAHVYLTGYTPYPSHPNDTRLPHEVAKLQKQIQKTALGAESLQPWSHDSNVHAVIERLRTDGYVIAALEQTDQSINLPDYTPPEKIAIVLGREAEGMEPEVVAACDVAIEIPMLGQKESFNVVQAAAMTLYHCTYFAQN